MYGPLVIAAYLALAHAIPTKLEPGTDFGIEDVTSVVEERSLEEVLTGKSLLNFKYKGQLPDCSGAGNDPSLDFGKQPYVWNQGVQIPKGKKDHPCTNSYGGLKKTKCWTEYWLVEQEIVTKNWKNSFSAIDCSSTKDCDSSLAQVNQTCTTTKGTWTWGGDAGLEIDGSSLFSKLTGIKGKGAVNFKKDFGDDTQACMSDSTINRCRWDDKKCHQLWYADRVMRVYGYMQRVCQNTGQPPKEKVQMNQDRGDGSSVRGTSAFAFDIPINRMVGCNALCSDSSYKSPLPAGAALEAIPLDFFN